MTPAEIRWRAERLQHLLATEEMERFEAMAQVRQEAKYRPWDQSQMIAASALQTSALGQSEWKS